MELMEEDYTRSAVPDEISPDEQQLEVLEDIWLKAGEIGRCIHTKMHNFYIRAFMQVEFNF